MTGVYQASSPQLPLIGSSHQHRGAHSVSCTAFSECQQGEGEARLCCLGSANLLCDCSAWIGKRNSLGWWIGTCSEHGWQLLWSWKRACQCPFQWTSFLHPKSQNVPWSGSHSTWHGTGGRACSPHVHQCKTRHYPVASEGSWLAVWGHAPSLNSCWYVGEWQKHHSGQPSRSAWLCWNWTSGHLKLCCSSASLLLFFEAPRSPPLPSSEEHLSTMHLGTTVVLTCCIVAFKSYWSSTKVFMPWSVSLMTTCQPVTWSRYWPRDWFIRLMIIPKDWRSLVILLLDCVRLCWDWVARSNCCCWLSTIFWISSYSFFSLAISSWYCATSKHLE